MEPLVICEKSFPVLLDENGVPHVKLADLFEPFGLDVSSQAERLRKSAWARPGMIPGRRSDGKLTRFLCLPIEEVPMAFATLDANRVKPEYREPLISYQREVTRAVYSYIAKGGAVRPEAKPQQLLDLQQLIREMLREEPATDPSWPPEFTKRYEAWNGRAWRQGQPQPRSMRNANWFFYMMIFPPEILAVIKTRGIEEGCRLHQTLTDGPRGYLRRCLEQATKLADECKDETEWRTRMRRWYGKTPAQLAGQAALGL